MLDRREIDRISAYLRRNDISHMLTVDLGEQVFVSLNCTQENFVNFLMAVAAKSREFSEVIVAVAEEIEERGIDDIRAEGTQIVN